MQHHIGISMIGAGSIDSEFFRGKAAQERLAAATPTPHTILRTTMLHEFVPRLVDHAATTHLVRLPPVRVQPAAAADIAAEVVRRALDAPLNGVFELAGPEVYFLDELARQVLAADGDTRRVLADHAAFYLGARLAPGTEALLPGVAHNQVDVRGLASRDEGGPGRIGCLSPELATLLPPDERELEGAVETDVEVDHGHSSPAHLSQNEPLQDATIEGVRDEPVPPGSASPRRASSADRTEAAGGREIALVDVLDRLLADGVVLCGDLTLAIADVDLVHLSLRTLITSHHRRGGSVTTASRQERQRIVSDPDTVERDLVRLALTVVELLRQLMERQALRRIDAGGLTEVEEERIGVTLMLLSDRMATLREQFGLSEADLNLDLGPLGPLLPR